MAVKEGVVGTVRRCLIVRVVVIIVGINGLPAMTSEGPHLAATWISERARKISWVERKEFSPIREQRYSRHFSSFKYCFA